MLAEKCASFLRNETTFQMWSGLKDGSLKVSRDKPTHCRFSSPWILSTMTKISMDVSWQSSCKGTGKLSDVSKEESLTVSFPSSSWLRSGDGDPWRRQQQQEQRQRQRQQPAVQRQQPELAGLFGNGQQHEPGLQRALQLLWRKCWWVWGLAPFSTEVYAKFGLMSPLTRIPFFVTSSDVFLSSFSTKGLKFFFLRTFTATCWLCPHIDSLCLHFIGISKPDVIRNHTYFTVQVFGEAWLHKWKFEMEIGS